MSVLYPFGAYDDKSFIFFNDDAIEEIYYFGYCKDDFYLKNVKMQNFYAGKKVHKQHKKGK